MSQGPIIQPRLVGQATTSPGLTSRCRAASTADLIGCSWVQGMALGSPVVPEEKRMLVTVSGSPMTGSAVAVPAAARKLGQAWSPGRSSEALASSTIARGGSTASSLL